MGLWTRTGALSAGGAERRIDTWTAPDGSAFPIEVTVGKPLDVLALKDTSLAEVDEYAKFLHTTARALYTDTAASRAACPCCGAPSIDAPEALRVFDIAYVRCPGCGHGYVRDLPPAESLDALFEESEDHSGIYTDPGTIEVRLDQVARPKVRWVLSAYASACGGAPSTMIDVGAGGGHMVRGFQEAGIQATGYELSWASRRFASEQFDIDLIAADFLAAEGETVDLLTMWGLLEYTAEPAEFVAAAHRRLAPGGMLVVEVPRFESLSSAVQANPEAVIARHLDPTTHVNCFTDDSLATILRSGGFRPVAAWYFGMDAYELLVQVALRFRGDEAFAALAEDLLGLQATLDEALVCDDIVVAAVAV